MRHVLPALALAFSTQLLHAAEEPPNILFIYTDDHSHRTVGCYPEAREFVETPHIDALAENGVRFRWAYIGTWCTRTPSSSSPPTRDSPGARTDSAPRWRPTTPTSAAR